MKILLIGANGQVGWELSRKFRFSLFETIDLDLPDFDITDKAQVHDMVTGAMPDLVINAAAYTAVDKAESEPELAFAVNRDGSANLASACSEPGIPLIHISTDYVFDGSKQGYYIESDRTAPLNVYGKSKEQGDKAIRQTLRKHIILRTSWLYGIHGANFVKTMIRLGREREVIRVVADQRGCPTCASDLAEAILTIAEQMRKGNKIDWGTYHYCGLGATTWHGFAEAIFRLADFIIPLRVKKVESITTAQYPTPARRPLNSAMDCYLITRTFGIQAKPWFESLAATILLLLTEQHTG
ncbi:MAG TPA: dTDP-4-dehydrorhamnose reductase [Thermodesulfovibrionia bacterium]|nr:dTDP-4-dehydrorhamnose reductase [Thermodesulfovibrionia bacterium]